MCDTYSFKRENKRYFGKNSDRSENEPNLPLFVKSSKRKDISVKATYIAVDHIDDLYDSFIVKPIWCYGAEMGVNECGVAIGNEAVFTKATGTDKKTERLIGMDMLRLALISSSSSFDAVSCIISLLEKYGQGGNCGYDKKFYYDNSFLIQDNKEAYILETAGQHHHLIKIENDDNISNRLNNYHDGFNKYSDFLFTFFSASKERHDRVSSLLKKATNLNDAILILKDHEEKKDLFTKGSIKSVSMMKSPLGDQTTGSLIYESESPVVWTTGCSTPFLSLFKPVLLKNPKDIPFLFEASAHEYWLKHEIVNRLIYSGVIDQNIHKKLINKLQIEIIDEYKKTPKDDIERLCNLSKMAFMKEKELYDSYEELVSQYQKGIVKLISPWDKYSKNLK